MIKYDLRLTVKIGKLVPSESKLGELMIKIFSTRLRAWRRVCHMVHETNLNCGSRLDHPLGLEVAL